MSIGASAPRPVLPAGLPCWVELACGDEPAAQRFYGGLFGWKYQTHRDPATVTRRYTIASFDGVAVGGLYHAKAGHPLGWIPHLSVASTASTAEWVTTLGGRVILGPVQIPHRGSILHVIDPTGAPVVFWRPEAGWQFGTGRPNMFSGADLNTHDGPGADHFYGKLFQYTSSKIGDDDSVDYAEWRIDHEPVLYRYVMGSEYPPSTPPHWMVYFDVDPLRGTDATAGQVLMLGGAVVIEPYDTAFGRMAILADPEGAVFAVIDHSTVVEVGRAEVDDPYDD